MTAAALLPCPTLLPCPAGKKGKLPWWGTSGWATSAKATGSTAGLTSTVAREAAKGAVKKAAAGAGGRKGAAGGGKEGGGGGEA